MSSYDRQLQHLIKLAMSPGWKAYAWSRAKELDGNQSGMYAGIAEALKKAMTSRI